MGERVNGLNAATGFEVCGSVGEVASNPANGNLYFTSFESGEELDFAVDIRNGKSQRGAQIC